MPRQRRNLVLFGTGVERAPAVPEFLVGVDAFQVVTGAGEAFAEEVMGTGFGKNGVVSECKWLINSFIKCKKNCCCRR